MPEEKPRHYLHGDQKEDDFELWFCARCDHFVPETHFAEGYHNKQRRSDYERYLADKKRLPIFMRSNQGRFRRPANPPNCLAWN